MSTGIFKLALFFSCFIVSFCHAQCYSNLATEQFKKDLEEIENVISNPNSNRKDLHLIIERLEEITSIESVSDGNYFGKFHPKAVDIQKWKDWLTTNEEKLCWNDKEGKFYIRK